MAQFFQKPENALKRAEELEGVNQKVAALDTLENVIKSKRHRAWTPTLELILKKFLGLCTERREPRRAKEGLIQYRSIAANAEKGPASFLSVVNSFINDGEAAVKEAEKKAGLGADAVANLQDLEAEETPETMMISVLTNDLSDTGRADRDNYVQWLRFLWESYRACLEVLKNNPKLEKLYAETANKTFKFCVKYKRKVEFRRLKDLLKNHLTNAQLSHNVSPDPEQTLRLRLDIRVEQLNAACGLELWQLAFESAEEFHNVVSHPANRKAMKGRVMMNYYDKVSQVFWVSENYLFHACAMQQIFTRSKRRLDGKVSKGELTPAKANDQLAVNASRLLLATLSIDLPSINGGGLIEADKDKHQRMATLVQHSSVPARRQLVQELVSKNVLQYVLPELAELHKELEGDVDPSLLSSKITPVVKYIEANPELVQYLAPLKKMALIKLVQQLSLVYVTMRITDFAALANFMSLHDCEKYMVEAVARNQTLVRLDHKNGTIHLGDRGLESQDRRSQLTNLAKGLQSTLDLIHRDLKAQARAQKAEAFKQLAETLEDERKMMSMRRQQIEQRKEIVEQEMAMQAQREAQEKKAAEEERRQDEERRKEEGKKKREEARAQEEKDIKELAEKKRLKEQVDALKAEENKKKGKVVVLNNEDEDDVEAELKNIDKAELIKRKKEQEEKLKREAEERLASNMMKLDHLERARREKERPLLGELLKTQLEEDKVNIETQKRTFLENHKKAHATDVASKAPLMRMMADKDIFEKQVTARRKTEYTRAQEFRRKEQEKEREHRRKEEQRKEDEAFKEEEERAQKEEEAAEKAEIMKKHRAEEREKADEMNKKQREREAEIDARAGGGGGGGGGAPWRLPPQQPQGGGG
eukprot:CAMPEP_0180140808 /NCGR_PEP_ID=MMETSP0986-20121125/14477_1 /TAXON_ID=697907 /ORGANISM="non described non described, Strain CCMP2293" /LENGTH=874 /DNA_ID=CAMNT_0022083429 /DNA_START=79 /DNA_END=2700 /DNA_ORIENTATION=+